MANIDNIVAWISDLDQGGHARRQQAERALLDSADLARPLLRKASTLHDRPWMALRSARLLAMMGDARAVQPLIAALNRPETRQRQLAVQTLLEHPSPDASAALLLLAQGAADDEDSRTLCASALQALARCLPIMPSDALHIVDDLVAFLQRDDAFIRAAAGQALARICCAQSQDALSALLEDHVAIVRLAAARSFEFCGVPELHWSIVVHALEQKLEQQTDIQAALLRALASPHSQPLWQNPERRETVLRIARAYLDSGEVERVSAALRLLDLVLSHEKKLHDADVKKIIGIAKNTHLDLQQTAMAILASQAGLKSSAHFVELDQLARAWSASNNSQQALLGEMLQQALN